MKRRHFIKTSSLLGAGAMMSRKDILGKKTIAPVPESSRVVVAHDSRLQHVSNAENAITEVLDRAVSTLFADKAETVWPALFSPQDIVGLKVNCLAGKGLSTHPEVVNAVVKRLLNCGIPPHHIIIWDRRDRDLQRAGFRVVQNSRDVQCYGNDRAGFTSQIFEFGSVGSQISNTLYRDCTAIINLPILKDHGIVGISGGMKNFFGAINNPNKYHMDVGDPFVADVNMLPPIRQKNRLTLCDAITAQYHGGPPFMPQWTWPMNSLIAATDMVALDTFIWQTIEQKRAEHGMETLEQEGRQPTYIATAARHGLGTNDPKRFEVLQI